MKVCHVTFIFTLEHDSKKLFGKIIFNSSELYPQDIQPPKCIDKIIKTEIFEAMTKSIKTIGIISIFDCCLYDISEDEKFAFDLYINCIKDYYYPIISH